MRTVASTELLVLTPVTTSVSTPESRSCRSRPVPMKALLVCFGTIVSPAAGATSYLNSLTSWPGR